MDVAERIPIILQKLSQRLPTENISLRQRALTQPFAVQRRLSKSIHSRIIGERINPTGKKLFKQALVENNIDYILTQALSQVQGGAEILDVNVGHPEIDEKKMMVRVLMAIQSVCDVPLQIDSTKPEVIEAGLRYYNGKPILNSVNGEEQSLATVLPLVKSTVRLLSDLHLTKTVSRKPPRADLRLQNELLKEPRLSVLTEKMYISTALLLRFPQNRRLAVRLLRLCTE